MNPIVPSEQVKRLNNIWKVSKRGMDRLNSLLETEGWFEVDAAVGVFGEGFRRR